MVSSVRSEVDLPASPPPVWAGAGQGVGDRDRRAAAAAVGVGGILLDRLGRAHHLGIRIVALRRGAGVVVVHVGGDLHAHMAGADHAGDDGFDALAQPVFVIGGVLFLVGGAGVGAGLVVAAGQKIAAVVDDGDAVGGRGWRRRRRPDAGWPRPGHGPARLRVFSTTEARGRLVVAARRSAVRE